MTVRQLTDFPQWLALAGDRCMAVRSHFLMQEAMTEARRRAETENANQQQHLEEEERRMNFERVRLELARAQEEEARFRASQASYRTVDAVDRMEFATEQDDVTREEEEQLENEKAEQLRKEEEERQAREQEERMKKLEEQKRRIDEQKKQQELQKKVQEERARQNAKPVITNQPHVNFMSFIGSGKSYLKFNKQELPPKLCKKMNEEVIQYPIGIAYDERAHLWFICDRNTHNMVVFNMKTEFITICDQLTMPTAVMVYEEGRSVAVLCAYKNMHTIYTYDYSTAKPTIKSIISHEEDIYDMKYKLRGLAKSVGSNILSMETNTIRVFKRNVGGKVFEMADTLNPSFLATYKTLIAVSDVILNKVFVFSMDDRKWDAITFNKLKVIGTDMDVPTYKLADQSGFKFVSGVQFDAIGSLMVADSKGHTMKVYDREFKFVHRVSSVFPLPYVTSFHINKEGECILLDTKDPDVKLYRVKLTSGPTQFTWLRPEYWGSKDPDHQPKSSKKF